MSASAAVLTGAEGNANGAMGTGPVSTATWKWKLAVCKGHARAPTNRQPKDIAPAICVY